MSKTTPEESKISITSQSELLLLELELELDPLPRRL